MSNRQLYLFVIELPLKPLIICITETKLKGIPVVNISLPGYVFIHENSSTNAGGIGIYISKNLTVSFVAKVTVEKVNHYTHVASQCLEGRKELLNEFTVFFRFMV